MKTNLFYPVLILTMALMSLNVEAQDSNPESTRLVPVHFNFEKAQPLSSLQRVLNELTTVLNSSESYRIMIIGHTDAIGDEDYNLRLSQNRAESIYNYFVKNGIDKERMKSQGKGETKPVASNDTHLGRSENRRVEIYVEVSQETAVINQKKDIEPQEYIDNTIQLPKEHETITETSVNYYSSQYFASDSLLSSYSGSILPVVPKQKLPKDAVEPIKGCRAFFSGLLMADQYMPMWTSKIWEPDGYSEYVGAGNYHNLKEAFPKSILSTFDGIAIDSNTRIIIYDQPNFKGKVVLNVIGPLIINNSAHQVSLPNLNTEAFETEGMNKLFPPEKRIWSNTNMYAWQNGSIRIMSAVDSVD